MDGRIHSFRAVLRVPPLPAGGRADAGRRERSLRLEHLRAVQSLVDARRRRLARPADGVKVIGVEFRSNSDMSLFLIDLASGEATEVTPHEGEVKFLPGPWAADGSGFYVLSDEGREFVGLAFQPVRADGEGGEREWVETPDRDIDELAGSAD